jgi:cyclohexyl-isocyanide hydratase
MKAAFIIFHRITALDFVGFYGPVTRLKSMNIMEDFEWRVCSIKPRVVDDRGLYFRTEEVGKSLDGYDMLFVPGGFGTRDLAKDGGFIGWLKTAERVPLKVSVCTSALLMGAAEFLKGKRATTHPGAYRDLEPYCAAVVRERVIDEGDIITARGVTAALDAGLHLVQRLAGKEARERVAAQVDYPYHP